MIVAHAGDLRRLAEAAVGLRDVDLQMVTDQSGGLAYRTAIQPGDTLLFTTRTNNRLQRAAAAASVSCSGMVLALKECDSVFWTEAAVEKFVWPYYEAHGINVARIRAAYESDPNIVAIAHLWPTIPTLVVSEGDSLQLLTWEQYSTRQAVTPSSCDTPGSAP